MMDEELRSQIEQLRANRAKRRMELEQEDEEIKLERPRRSRRAQEDDDFDEKPPKRDDGVWGVLTFQSILTVVLAIAYVVLMTFSPAAAGEAFRLVRDTAEHDFSFKDQVYDTVGAVMTYLNELQPVQVDPSAGVSSGEMTSEPADGTSSGKVDSQPGAGASSSETLANSEPSANSAGRGGEFTPVRDQMLPPNATFAPVVYTGRITFPIEGGGRITSTFGFRDHPTNGAAEFHTAVDIAAAKGTNVLAAADGTVVTCEETAGLGKHIVIDHGHDFLTVYGHCDKLLAKVGTRVREGEVIAKVGNTGDSTGYHLHFGMKKSGLYFNPAYIFPQYISGEEE